MAAKLKTGSIKLNRIKFKETGLDSNRRPCCVESGKYGFVIEATREFSSAQRDGTNNESPHEMFSSLHVIQHLQKHMGTE